MSNWCLTPSSHTSNAWTLEEMAFLTEIKGGIMCLCKRAKGHAKACKSLSNAIKSVLKSSEAFFNLSYTFWIAHRPYFWFPWLQKEPLHATMVSILFYADLWGTNFLKHLTAFVKKGKLSPFAKRKLSPLWQISHRPSIHYISYLFMFSH